MWEMRKLYVAQIGRQHVDYIGESEERAEQAVRAHRSKDDGSIASMLRESPHVEAWVCAVRFEGLKAVEVVGLGKCPPAGFDPLEGLPLDIAPRPQR